MTKVPPASFSPELVAIMKAKAIVVVIDQYAEAATGNRAEINQTA
jgi:hypothetical protein